MSRCEDFAGSSLIGVMGELDESVVVSEFEIDKRRDQALYESRAVSCYQDDEGMWIIKAKLENLVSLCRYHHRELHRGKFFLTVKPLCSKDKFKEPVRFADRLCFLTMDRYFDAPFNRPPLRSKEDQVIARNPAKFTCACCRVDELEASLPRSVYAGIDATTAVTKWLGEGMDLGLAIEGLLVASGKVVNFRGI